MLETLATVAILSMAIPRVRDWLCCVAPMGSERDQERDRGHQRRGGRPPLPPMPFPTVQIPSACEVQVATPYGGNVALSSSNCFVGDSGTQEQIIAQSPTGDELEDDLISTTCSWLHDGSCRTLAFSDSFLTNSRCTSFGAGHASWKMDDQEEDQEESTRACKEAVKARIVGRSGCFYDIHVAVGHATPAWTLIRRYRDFKTLDALVRVTHSDLPRLPQRSIFFRRHFKPGFTHRFEEGLTAYVEALVSNPSTVAEPAVHHFLGVVGRIDNDL